MTGEAMRPWRSLIRITRIEDGKVYGIVSGYCPTEEVALAGIPGTIDLAPGKRLHAMVNIGAEASSELQFERWENQ